MTFLAASLFITMASAPSPAHVAPAHFRQVVHRQVAPSPSNTGGGNPGFFGIPWDPYPACGGDISCPATINIPNGAS